MVKFKVFSHKEKILCFPHPVRGGRTGRLVGLLQAVVSLLRTLFQQDLQQVIKSTYSFKKSPGVRFCASQCWVGKGRFCRLTHGFTRKADTISEVTEPWYEYWIGGVVGLACETDKCASCKCFSMYKDALQIHFWQSKKRKNINNKTKLLEGT